MAQTDQMAEARAQAAVKGRLASLPRRRFSFAVAESNDSVIAVMLFKEAMRFPVIFPRRLRCFTAGSWRVNRWFRHTAGLQGAN